MRVSQELRDFIISNMRVHLSLDSSSKTKRKLQHFASVKPSPNIRSEYEHLLSTAIAAEKACPGSGLAFLELITNCEISVEEPLVINRKDIDTALLRLNLNKEVLDILRVVVEYSSRTSTITIKKSIRESYVEISEGYNFHVHAQLHAPPTTLEKAGVACIDGYVESVSELHHLFVGLSESKTPCLLFTRGLSDDVLNTIKVNNDRKTMLVFPYLVPYDLDSVNVLVDLAVTSGTDVISSTKGQLISSLTCDQLGLALNCNIFDRTVKYNNPATRKRVLEHLGTLKHKIEERTEIQDILSKRLQSLSSRNIEIGIPDGINYFSHHQQLDEGIRTISSMIKSDYKPQQYAKLFLESYEKHSASIHRHLL